MAGQERIVIAFDSRLLDDFLVFDVHDPADMDRDSRISRRFPGFVGNYAYMLRDRPMRRERPGGRLTRLATRLVGRGGELVVSYVADRFGTEIRTTGQGLDRYCLGMMLDGGMEMLGGPGGAAQARGGHGLVMHGGHGTRFLTGDNNARLNLWVDARRVERALEALLDEPLREPLVFRPSLDWTSGAGATLRRLFGLLVEELAQPDGLPSNAPAMASFADLLTQTMLHGLPHNHLVRLARRRPAPVPRHLRRAEEYLRAHADRPLALEEVAAAAGCCLRTLLARLPPPPRHHAAGRLAADQAGAGARRAAPRRAGRRGCRRRPQIRLHQPGPLRRRLRAPLRRTAVRHPAQAAVITGAPGRT